MFCNKLKKISTILIGVKIILQMPTIFIQIMGVIKVDLDLFWIVCEYTASTILDLERWVDAIQRATHA